MAVSFESLGAQTTGSTVVSRFLFSLIKGPPVCVCGSLQGPPELEAFFSIEQKAARGSLMYYSLRRQIFFISSYLLFSVV